MRFVTDAIVAVSAAIIGYGAYKVFELVQEMKEDVKDIQVVLADYAGKSDY